jgi:ABC-type glutathione transport system ATPase component
MSAALEVSNVSVSVRRGDERFNAVESVSFSLEAGEAFGIVGESGSGKSLTLRAIMGLLPASARLIDGEMVFEGRELSA